jgi:hypothetical protein
LPPNQVLRILQDPDSAHAPAPTTSDAQLRVRSSTRRIRKLSGEVLYDLPPKEDDEDDSDEIFPRSSRDRPEIFPRAERPFISPSTEHPSTEKLHGSQDAKLELHPAPQSVRASSDAGPSGRGKLKEAVASLDQRLESRRLSELSRRIPDEIQLVAA